MGIGNTSTSGPAVRFINGASRNTIQSCGIGAINTATTSGVVLFSTSNGVTGNNNNTIDSCTIGDLTTGAFPANGITSIGTASTAQLNTGNVISNNNIANFFSAGSATNGILLTTNTNLSNTGWTITNNRLFQTAPRTYTTGTTHRAIQINGGSDYTISGNTIGFASPAGAGTYAMAGAVSTSFQGIAFAGGDGRNSIQGNTISGISLSTTTGTLTGITVTAVTNPGST